MPGGKGGDTLESGAERTGYRRAASHGRGGLRFAFYGRVSTEDWLDPVTSRARHRDQAAALVAGHGRIVAEFFDTGYRRTLAWARRPQAAALAAASQRIDRCRRGRDLRGRAQRADRKQSPTREQQPATLGSLAARAAGDLPKLRRVA